MLTPHRGMQPMTSFKEVLHNKLESSKSNNFTDNYDYRRFGHKNDYTAKNLLKKFLSYIGIYYSQPQRDIKNNIERLDWLYRRLDDDESRDILVQVLSYRLLGNIRVKLPLNTSDYWMKLEELDNLAKESETIELGYYGWRVNKMSLQGEGYPLELFARPSGIYTQLILQQYRCQMLDSAIEVEAGDIVMDAGACFGDTALYFAYKSRRDGQVFAWEIMPENLDIFARNMALNPKFAERIELVESLLASLDSVASQDVDILWGRESEDRIDAFERGEIPTISAKEVFDDSRER